MARTKIEVFDRSILVAMAGDQGGIARAAIARRHLAEVEEINRRSMGRIPDHETWVDGRHGAPLETVGPNGRIIFEFDLMSDVFEWIGEMLVRHSPVLDGDYQASHLFFADGLLVRPGRNLPAAEEYVFINAQPYARKIERGLSDQAPDGVYEAVATMARQRFGNLASIRFSYRSLQGSGLVDYISAGSGSREDRAVEHDTRQPAIIIGTG